MFSFCIGVQVLNNRNRKIENVFAKVTYLVTGGSGSIFKNTTNPLMATGDGVAMAARAGAKIQNMNFFQFHPTALYEKGKQPLFLISEQLEALELM